MTQARCENCRTSRRETHHDRTGQVVCLNCYLQRHHTDPVVPARPHGAPGRTSRRAILTDRLVDTLTALELRPVVVSDKPPLVRCLCPACGSPDSDGMWRSLLVDGRQGLAWACDNDCAHDNIVTAFRRLVEERTSSAA